MKAEDLFGQLSHTGKPFDCGYYIVLFTGSYHFAKGEEKERDQFLTEKNIYDEETPNWETLVEFDDESFYYSEWFVSDDMDGGYDKDGDYYYCVDGEFIKEINLDEDYEICGGDGLENEIWRHRSTREEISVDIIITRSFNGRILN